MLIKTISTKRLFFNELTVYRKNDNERVDKDFIITETSKVHQSTETRQCRIFDQSCRIRLNKIRLILMTNEVWLSSCHSIKKIFRKEFYFLINQQSQLMIRIRLKISNSLRFELKISNSKREFSTRIKDLASIEIF
jgi:hypothetical protein